MSRRAVLFDAMAGAAEKCALDGGYTEHDICDVLAELIALSFLALRDESLHDDSREWAEFQMAIITRAMDYSHRRRRDFKEMGLIEAKPKPLTFVNKKDVH